MNIYPVSMNTYEKMVELISDLFLEYADKYSLSEYDNTPETDKAWSVLEYKSKDEGVIRVIIATGREEMTRFQNGFLSPFAGSYDLRMDEKIVWSYTIQNFKYWEDSDLGKFYKRVKKYGFELDSIDMDTIYMTIDLKYKL